VGDVRKDDRPERTLRLFGRSHGVVDGRVKALSVLKGQHQFSIHRAPNPETAKALALKILPRLPS
jgi:hypothetical protein